MEYSIIEIISLENYHTGKMSSELRWIAYVAVQNYGFHWFKVLNNLWEMVYLKVGKIDT